MNAPPAPDWFMSESVRALRAGRDPALFGVPLNDEEEQVASNRYFAWKVFYAAQILVAASRLDLSC